MTRTLPGAIPGPSITEAGSWLKRVTVLASSYVAPPIMKTITSWGLRGPGHGVFLRQTIKLVPLQAGVWTPLTVQEWVPNVSQPSLEDILQRLGEMRPMLHIHVFDTLESIEIRRQAHRNILWNPTFNPFSAERPLARKDSVENKSSCR
jgi:hypothetical protein